MFDRCDVKMGLWYEEGRKGKVGGGNVSKHIDVDDCAWPDVQSGVVT